MNHLVMNPDFFFKGTTAPILPIVLYYILLAIIEVVNVVVTENCK